MWRERWSFSFNAKDIGTLYLIFALFSGLLGTAFSVLIRLELSGPGVQSIADNQLYHSGIAANAVLMICFIVMLAMIGKFGNLLLPLIVGGPDMAFSRLNKISFWLLLPSLILLPLIFIIMSLYGIFIHNSQEISIMNYVDLSPVYWVWGIFYAMWHVPNLMDHHIIRPLVTSIIKFKTFFFILNFILSFMFYYTGDLFILFFLDNFSVVCLCIVLGYAIYNVKNKNLLTIIITIFITLLGMIFISLSFTILYYMDYIIDSLFHGLSSLFDITNFALDILINYILYINTDNFLLDMANLYVAEESSNPAPLPPSNNNIPLIQTEDHSDDTSDDYVGDALTNYRRKGVKLYDLDQLYLSKGLSYVWDVILGEPINYIINNRTCIFPTALDLKNELKLDLSSLNLVSPEVGEFVVNIPEFIDENSSINSSTEMHHHVPLDCNTFILEKDWLKDMSDTDYKDIFKEKTLVRINDTQAYPLLKYLNQFDAENFRITNASNYLDAGQFSSIFGKNIGSDLRIEPWWEQLRLASHKLSYESETVMLHTNMLSEVYKLKEGFLIGAENRSVGGVADLLITKKSTPFIHVEYKSSGGDKFPKMFAQAKKYIYNHHLLGDAQQIFGMYAKGPLVSYFIVSDHGHSDYGLGLKGPMYNGMFGLFVDLQEMCIRILPQENSYFPQYICYNIGNNEGYLRSELIQKFMSLHDEVPEVGFCKKSNRFEFKVVEAYKSCPVQIFHEEISNENDGKKIKDIFKVSFVDNKGNISFKEKISLNDALHFTNRPSDVLTTDFVHSRFKGL